MNMPYFQHLMYAIGVGLMTCIFMSNGSTDPTDVTCNAPNSTTLVIEWTQATDPSVAGYKLDIERVDGLKVEAPIETVTLDNKLYENYSYFGMGIYAEYSITLQSLLTSGADGADKVLRCKTLSGVPDAATFNLTCWGISYTEIECEWKSLPEVYWNGDGVGYQLRYIGLINDDWDSIDLGLDKTDYVVKRLTFDTHYILQLRFENDAGFGPMTSTKAKTLGWPEKNETETRYYCYQVLPGYLEIVDWMEMTCAVYTGTIAGLLFLTLVLGLILCCRKSETSKSSTQIAVNMTSNKHDEEEYEEEYETDDPPEYDDNDSDATDYDEEESIGMDGKPTFVEDNERKTRNDDAEVDDGDDDDGENSTENENEDDAYENNIEDVVISQEARGRIGDNKSHSIENAKEEGDDDDEEEETLEEDNELSDTKEDDELSDTNKDNLTTDATKLKKEKKLEALRVAKELKAIKKEARKQKHASEKTAIVKTNGSATHLNVNTKDDTNKQSKLSKLNKDTQVNTKQGKHKRRRGYSSDDDYEEDEDDTYYEDWNPDAEKNPEIILMKIKDDKDGNTEQENNDSSNKMKKSSEKRTKLNDKKIKLSEKDTGNKRRKHNKSYDKDNIKHIDNVDDCDNDGNSYNDDDAGNYKNNGDGDYDDDTDDENSDADDPDVDDIDHGDHENAKENKRNKQSTGKSGKNKSSKQASKSPISKVGTTFDIENVSTFNSNHTNSNVYQSKNQNNEQSVKIMFKDDLKNNLTEEFESISQTSEDSGRGSENSDWGFKRNSKEHTRVINQNVQKTELTDLGNKTELKGAKPKKKKVGFFSSLFGGNKANTQSNSRDKTNNETTPGGRLVNSEAATKPNENYDNVFVNPKLNAQLYKKTLFNNQSDQKVDYGDWDDGNFNEDYLPKNASNNATQGYGLSNDSSPYLTQPGEYSGTYMKHQNGTTEAMNMKTPTGYEQMNDGTMKRKSDYNNPITPLGFKKVADNIIKPVHTFNDSHIGGTRISNRNEIEGNSINQLDTFFDTHVRNPYDTLELNQNKTDKRTKFNELFKTNARNKKNQLAQINTHADADRPHGHTNNDITNKNMKEAGNNQPNSYPNLQATRFNAPAQPNRSDPEPTKSFMLEGNENQPYSNPNVQAMRHGSSAKNKRSDKETTLTSPKHVQVTRNNDFLINQSDGLTRHRPRSSLSGHDDAHKNNFQGQPKDGPSGESLRKNFTDHPKKLVSFRTTYPDSTSIKSNQQQDHVQKPLDNGGDEDIEYHIADNQRGSQRRTPTSFVSGNKPAWQMQVPKDESQKGFINGGRSKTPVKDITKRNERQTLTDPEPVLDTDRLGKKFPFLKTKDSAGKSNDPIRKNQSDSNLVLKGSISNPMNGKVDNHLTRNSRLSLPNTMPDEEKGEVEKFKNLNPDLRDKVFYGFGVGRWRYAAVKWLNMWKMKRRPVKTGDSNWD